MTEQQITLKEALQLVTFKQFYDIWHVDSIHDSVYGNVQGNVEGDVEGDIMGSLWGTIKGRKWKFVETPKERFERLLEKTGNEELIDAYNQLEDNQ